MVTAIIMAGGSGERMGEMTLPKQFIEVYGKPIIIHTLELFDIHPEIDEIVVCCKQNFIDDLRIMIRKFNIAKVKAVVNAGETRQESCFNGLEYLRNYLNDDDLVVIHDAVRPLLTGKIVSKNIEAARKYGAVDTAIPSADTLIRTLDGKFIDSVPTRSELYLGQTPQSFKFGLIYNAHVSSIANNIENATDDCRLALSGGHKVAIVEGDKLNFKITTQEDLTLLKAIIKLGKLEKI